MTAKLYSMTVVIMLSVSFGSSNLCQECRCTLDVIDCTRTQFLLTDNTTIDSAFREGHFSGLSLTAVEPTTFICANCSLQMLDLSANDIQIIPGKTFQAVETLTVLDLRNNKISKLKTNSFKGLLDLTILDLGFNRIEHLPADLLDELSNLYRLDLKYNEIAHIPDDFFFSSKNLRTLDISHLRLQSLPKDLFVWNLSIEELDISHNLFTVVPTEALSHLGESLKTLKMSGNRLTTLHSGAFYGLRYVKYLQMEQLLQLRTIEAYAFSGMDNLETIELRYLPEIRTIDEKAFNLEENTGNDTSPLCPIYDFSLCFSTLAHLPPNLIHWENVRQIMLRNNRWNCNCTMKWVKDSIVEEKTGSSMYCTFPDSVRGLNVLGLEKDDFTCEKGTEVYSGSGIGALIFIFVLGLVVSTATVMILVYRRNGWLIRRPRGFNLLHNETITVFDRTEHLPTISKPYQTTVISSNA